MKNSMHLKEMLEHTKFILEQPDWKKIGPCLYSDGKYEYSTHFIVETGKCEICDEPLKKQSL